VVVSIAVVTGGAGFLGSHFCEYLLERDWRVLCLDNLDTGTLENIESLRGENFEFRYHNCVDHIDVEGPVDAVFHLASPASPVDYLRLPLATLKVGSYGTHNALGLAKFKRARFLLTSTSEVYGDPEIHPQREEYWGNVNPVGPRGVYDEAKRYAEALTMAYHRQQGVDTHIARIFNTYGPRMRENDGRAIPTFLRQAMEGKPLTVFGDGSQTRSFCYVDDLIEGLFRLIMSDEHMPVNIGNPNEMTLLELAERVISLTGADSRVVFEGLPVDDPKVRQPDITKAIKVLDWEPRVSLDDGLQRTIATLTHSRARTAR
jgi:dTDP-glucose 4,6-dehydratase